jgi:hypothetical protein
MTKSIARCFFAHSYDDAQVELKLSECTVFFR